MPAFSSLQRASFCGVEFPIKHCRMRGSFRHFEHIYLKTPGAVIEKLSRGLYRIEMDGAFDRNIKGFGDLWPTKVAQLRKLYELGTRGPLVVPMVGTMQAWLPDWDQALDSKVLSGESVPLTFMEDQSVAFIESALKKTTSTSLANAHDSFQIEADKIDPRPDIFDQIRAAANSVFAVFDEGELQLNLLSAKIDGLSEILREADRDLNVLQDPMNFELVYALQDLLAAGLQLGRDLVQRQGEARIYTLPTTMTVAQISNAIYHDTTHFNDIVNANTIEDPYSVPAGTQIVYFTGGILNAA